MQIEFENEEIELLIERGKGKNSLYKKLSKQAIFMRKLDIIMETLSSAKDIKSVFEFSYLHCEYLKHNLLGKFSIRILQGKPYRLIFREHRDKVTIEIIEINEHYGNK